jgi:regulation of enolase protein 1 (concanavalin A-like superfamily)
LTGTAQGSRILHVSELTHPALPFPLSPHGTKACAFRLDGEVLRVTGEGHSDLFIDPSGVGGVPPEAGYLLGVAPEGDFTFSARVTVPFSAVFDAGVLLVYAGPDRFAKLCFEFSPQREPMAVTVVTRGFSDDSNAFVVEGDALWLRVSRVGSAWAFHASLDGEWWRLLRYFTLGESEPSEPGGPDGEVRIGFLAQSPTGSGIEVVYDRIAFAPGAPKDLRDGS